jgi:CheY-like chemotaxis protein
MPATTKEGHADPLRELQTRYDALVREQLQAVQERNQMARQLAAAPRADSAERMADMERVLQSIRQARDFLLTRNHEIIAELARADDRVAELVYEHEVAAAARDAALKDRDERSSECEKLRRGALELQGQIAALVEEGTRYSTDLVGARQTIEELTKELEEVHALADDRLVRSISFAPNCKRPGKAAVPVPAPPAESQAVAVESRNFRARREAAILAEQFAAALRERDSARAGAEKIRVAQEQAVSERDQLRTELETVRDTLEKQIAGLRAQIAAGEPPSPPAPASNVPTGGATREVSTPELTAGSDPASALDSLEECLVLLAAHPDNLNLLDALESQLRTLSDCCHAAGLGAAHRYTVACRELTRGLHKTPAKIPSVLPTLHRALNLLCALTATPATGEEATPDPAGALVYSVDDDADNCECISAALEKATLFTKYATRPEVALAELIVLPCELIILDVNMPGMDGFELCAKIRAIEHHRDTPILFVSGLMSTRERLKTINSEGIEFFPKPYNLSELTVKALTMILAGPVQGQD